MTRIFRSLRWRVQYGHICAMSLLIPTVIYLSHQWWQHQNLIRSDKELALAMNSLWASDFKNAPKLPHEGMWFVVQDGEGQIFLKSESIPSSLPPISDFDSQGFRFYQQQRLLGQSIEGRNYSVYVGVPEKVVYQGSSRFLILLSASLTLLAILALVVAWWHSGKSLYPIQRFTKTARRMSESTRFENLDLSNTHNELQELGQVLNLTFSRLHRSLEQQKKLTADASHELRTPLTALIAQVKRGQSSERSKEDFQEIFEICDRSLVRLKRIVDDLLELSQYDSGRVELDREELALDLLVTTIAEDYRPMMEAQGNRMTCEVTPCRAYCDPFRIEQVFSNLIGNAVNHNEEPVEISLRVKAEDDWVVVEVEDNGVGISPEHVDHLFDRFYQEKKNDDISRPSSKEKSSGLGLAISKAIVEAHEGTIRVSSKPNVATVFAVRLPAKGGS